MDKDLDMLRCTNEEAEKCDYCKYCNQCDREEALRKEQGTSKKFTYRDYR